jgi:mannose-6-phosphate isomerase-like protein (cupin superfamily)
MADTHTGPAQAREVRVRRGDDARVLMAGDEMAAVYFWTDRLVFSVSQIPPGGRSTLDPGHKGADEVCYVIKGTLVLEFPELQRWERIAEGDAIVIPENEPHTAINPGSEVAVSVWATAPHLGYEIEELTGVPSPQGQ